MAAAVATVVVTNVEPAKPPDAVAEPALNPYQPNHSRPAPSITNGRLCGRIGVPGQPLRLPRMMREHQAGGTGVDVNRCATGEVDRRELVGDPATRLGGGAVEREHPVRDREVDEGRPQAGEQQPAAELEAVGHRAGDQGDGDDREHQLEGDEHRCRQA